MSRLPLFLLACLAAPALPACRGASQGTGADQELCRRAAASMLIVFRAEAMAEMLEEESRGLEATGYTPDQVKVFRNMMEIAAHAQDADEVVRELKKRGVYRDGDEVIARDVLETFAQVERDVQGAGAAFVKQCLGMPVDVARCLEAAKTSEAIGTCIDAWKGRGDAAGP
jgi:hypothetical protein